MNLKTSAVLCKPEWLALAIVLLSVVYTPATAQTTAPAAAPGAAPAVATFRYSGSDTLEPVVSAALTAFARGNPAYKLQIQSAGTSVGLRDLCVGRTPLAGASRTIKPAEAKLCSDARIQYLELPIALDALALVVSNKNTWLKDLTFTELRTVFDPASAGNITSWKQVRPGFPDTPIRAAGPDIKHGTFAAFSESLGLKGFIRSDFKDFPQHYKTGRYVADTAGALGFMPLGDALSMTTDIRAVGIDFGAGPVVPTAKEITAGTYAKLSRTVFLYVNSAAVIKSEPKDIEFTRLLLTETEKFVEFANLVPLKAPQYQDNLKRWSAAR
jgi:phosphate transport system substrate-binding protein